MPAPSRLLPCRAALAGLIAAVLIGGAGAAVGQGPDQDDAARRSAVAYAEWAERVLAAPLAGIRFLPMLEERLAQRVGKERDERGLRDLRPAAGLERAARAHAVDMLQRDYISHVGPDGRSATERVGILDRRFIGVAGENLAENVGIPAAAIVEQIGPMAAKLVGGFLESPDHRENLLDPDYTDHGIAAAAAGERLTVVHVFGARRAALEQDLPLQVSEGAELPLSFEQGDGLSTPAKYAFARIGQPRQEVVPLDLALRGVVVEPGTYQLQFLLPTEQRDRFAVLPGPIVVVR